MGSNASANAPVRSDADAKGAAREGTWGNSMTAASAAAAAELDRANEVIAAAYHEGCVRGHGSAAAAQARAAGCCRLAPA